MGLLVSRFAPNGVGGGINSSLSWLDGYKLYSREQIVVQIRIMHLMIGATLKSDYVQVVLKTQTNNERFFFLYCRGRLAWPCFLLTCDHLIMTMIVVIASPCSAASSNVLLHTTDGVPSWHCLQQQQ